MPGGLGLAGGTPWGAIAQGVGGLISGIAGISQKHQAKKMLKNLQYPTESMPKEYLQNQQLATQQAATGMPSEQYAQAMKNIQRQQLSALRGAQDRRAGVGLIPTLQQNTNDAFLNLDAQNAQMRLANQRNLMNVNNQVAGVKRDLFNLNTRDKYNRDYNYAMSLMGAGNQNFTGGLDKLGAAGIGLLGGGFGGGGNNTNQSGYGGDQSGISLYDVMQNRNRNYGTRGLF